MMLTKEQIKDFWDWHECNCKFAFDAPTSFDVCKQAISAIDLAAENERLKAKLDAVRTECNKAINGWKGHILQNYKDIQAIIGKDGDDT